MLHLKGGRPCDRLHRCAGRWASVSSHVDHPSTRLSRFLRCIDDDQRGLLLRIMESFVMASRRFTRKRYAHKPPEGLCSAWGAEDGIDPRLAPQRPQGTVSNRKALQLCRQVER